MNLKDELILEQSCPSVYKQHQEKLIHMFVSIRSYVRIYSKYTYFHIWERQNQRLKTGPGPILPTCPITRGIEQTGACHDRPPNGFSLALLFLVSLNRATSRNRGYVTSPVFQGNVTEGCRRWPWGKEFRLLAIYDIYIQEQKCTHLCVCTYIYIYSLTQI